MVVCFIIRLSMFVGTYLVDWERNGSRPTHTTVNEQLRAAIVTPGHLVTLASLQSWGLDTGGEHSLLPLLGGCQIWHLDKIKNGF